VKSAQKKLNENRCFNLLTRHYSNSAIAKEYPHK